MTSSETALPGTDSRTRIGIVAALAAIYLIWGSTYLGIRIAIESFPPFVMAGVRFLGCGLLLYFWSRWRGAPRPTAVQWRATAIVGAFLLLGGNGLVTWAETLIPSGLTALLVATVPLWMVLLDWAFVDRRRPSKRVFIGLALGLIGLVLLIGPANLMSEHRINLVGVGMVVLAALSWAIGSLYARRAPFPDAPLMTTGMEMLAGGALLVLAGGIKGEWGQIDLANASLRSWFALGYLMLFGSIVGYTAYTWLLRVTTPARASTYAYVNPVVAMVLGWLIVGEPLTGQMLGAAAIILVGVALITLERR